MKVLYASLLVVVIDQVTKLIVKGFSFPFLNISHNGMSVGERIPLIENFLSITFVENPGIALGIDFGGGHKLLITLFTIAATAGLFLYLYTLKEKSFMMRFPIALILGGGIGNLIDRVFYGIFYNYAPLLHGKVVDFIDVNFFRLFIFNRTIGSYILNVADLAVSAGVILLFFSLSRNKIRNEKDTGENEPKNILAENKE